MRKLIFWHKFINYRHKFFLIWFCLVKIFLKDFNFMIDSFQGFLIIYLMGRLWMLILDDMRMIWENKVFMILRGSFKCIHPWKTGKVRSNLFDFDININIKFLDTLNKIIESRFHLFFNSINQLMKFIIVTENKRSIVDFVSQWQQFFILIFNIIQLLQYDFL